jgi:hypothetical protein
MWTGEERKNGTAVKLIVVVSKKGENEDEVA